MIRDEKHPKILLIAPHPFYTDRGSPIAIFEELKILSKLDFQVDVATYPIGADIRMPGVKIIRTANPLRLRSINVGFSFRKMLLDLLLLFRVLLLTRKKQYDCIHGVEEGAAIAIVCKIFLKIPVIYDMHSSIPEQLRLNKFFRTNKGRNLALSFEKFLIINSDAIIASPGLSSYVLSILPKKPVWECRFPGLNSKNSSRTPALKLKILGRPTVVYTGNFALYQGLDLLIETAALISSKVPKVLFLLIGGTESDLKPIDRLVKAHDLEKTVYLIHRVPRQEVANYLAIANVLVLPRRKGMNTPLKIFDYMRSQKPIVATNIQAHTTLLDDNSAILVKPEPESLAKGILNVIQNKEIADKFAFKAEKAAWSTDKTFLRKTLIEIYSFALKGSNMN